MKREIKTEIKAYKIDISCKNCDGNMSPTGRSFLTYPQQFEHKCTKCDSTENFTDIYPKTIFE